jgi:hypothetical protein
MIDFYTFLGFIKTTEESFQNVNQNDYNIDPETKIRAIKF